MIKCSREGEGEGTRVCWQSNFSCHSIVHTLNFFLVFLQAIVHAPCHKLFYYSWFFSLNGCLKINVKITAFFMRASEKGTQQPCLCNYFKGSYFSLHAWPMVKGWWRFHGSFKPFQSYWCSYTSVLFYCIQRKNLTKKSPVIMPIVTEDFNIEKYAHVDALLANFQGVFLNQVTCVQFFFLTTA